jgi:hypothetical protein
LVYGWVDFLNHTFMRYYISLPSFMMLSLAYV